MNVNSSLYASSVRFTASSALPFFSMAIFINMLSSLKYGLNKLKMRELAKWAINTLYSMFTLK